MKSLLVKRKGLENDNLYILKSFMPRFYYEKEFMLIAWEGEKMSILLLSFSSPFHIQYFMLIGGCNFKKNFFEVLDIKSN
jgi:hypothetical protein